MLTQKPQYWMVGLLCAGVLLLSALSFLRIRDRLHSFQDRAEREWRTLDGLLGEQGDVAAGLLLRGRAQLPAGSPVLDDLAQATKTLAEAAMPVAKAVAYRDWWLAVERLVRLVEITEALKNDTELQKQLTRAQELNQAVEAGGKRYDKAAYQFNIQIRKNPDTRVVEGLGLKPREFFRPPEKAEP